MLCIIHCADMARLLQFSRPLSSSILTRTRANLSPLSASRCTLALSSTYESDRWSKLRRLWQSRGRGSPNPPTTLIAMSRFSPTSQITSTNRTGLKVSRFVWFPRRTRTSTWSSTLQRITRRSKRHESRPCFQTLNRLSNARKRRGSRRFPTS